MLVVIHFNTVAFLKQKKNKTDPTSSLNLMYNGANFAICRIEARHEKLKVFFAFRKLLFTLEVISSQ